MEPVTVHTDNKRKEVCPVARGQFVSQCEHNLRHSELRVMLLKRCHSLPGVNSTPHDYLPLTHAPPSYPNLCFPLLAKQYNFSLLRYLFELDRKYQIKVMKCLTKNNNNNNNDNEALFPVL